MPHCRGNPSPALMRFNPAFDSCILFSFLLEMTSVSRSDTMTSWFGALNCAHQVGLAYGRELEELMEAFVVRLLKCVAESIVAGVAIGGLITLVRRIQITLGVTS
jgi:hypothetical protein